MTEKSKNERRKLINLTSFVSKFQLEARRSPHGMSVIVGGVVGIIDFSSENVLLKSHGGKIAVAGKHLSIALYEGGVVEILGKVEDIGFRYGKN